MSDENPFSEPTSPEDRRWVGNATHKPVKSIEPINRREFSLGDLADYIPSDEDLENNDKE